ncbi:GNAT family N-acetyltransferase [Lysinibacillus sp. NPDC097162]|uniref:GNAT family N-acetyltransferase n=1 Tax=Lysinibacillus sp. NPDC097162 TaxID=3364140 RepID=UPI00381B1CD6
MMPVIEASIEHIDDLCTMDKEVIGEYSRKDMIIKAIEEKRCLIQRTHSGIAGFLIFTTNFFECSFISLVIVKPSERRKGVASSLLASFVSMAPTPKIFSSTNQSNLQMQKVFEEAGFNRSGFIENLDDGDPEIIYFKSKVIEIGK